METLELNQIKKEIIVAVSQQTAFEVFVQQMSRWWPVGGHIDGCPMVRVALEASEGGRWTGYNSKDDEITLGKVLVYEPFDLFVLDWQTDAVMAYNPDLHTEVRVEFVPLPGNQTRVKLTHSDIDKFGEAANGINEGWGDIMHVFQRFTTESFHTEIPISISPSDALRKISEIDQWWGVGFEGRASEPGDQFVIKMGPEAWFNYTITEKQPDKIVWHVNDCYMPWYADKTEWKGHDMVFEIKGNTLHFTHEGLVAGIACFKDCVPGWTHWITRSLRSYFETGKGDFKQR